MADSRAVHWAYRTVGKTAVVTVAMMADEKDYWMVASGADEWVGAMVRDRVAWMAGRTVSWWVHRKVGEMVHAMVEMTTDWMDWMTVASQVVLSAAMKVLRRAVWMVDWSTGELDCSTADWTGQQLVGMTADKMGA